MKKHLLSLTLLCAAVVQLIAQPCTKPFFSEYIEGTSNNKALEIYNPSSSPVDLSTYKIFQWRNGIDSVWSSISLSGTLAPHATFVVANPSADTVIKNRAQLLTGTLNFNGDDAMGLFSGTDTLDVIGVRRDSAVWTVDTADTKDNTLIRKPTIQEGDVNWTTAKLGWTAYPVNYFSNLGQHTMNPCAAPLDTTVSMSGDASVAENSGNYTLTLYLGQATAANKTIDVVFKGSPNGGTGADIGNFTSTTATFTAGNTTTTVSIPVTDDAIAEGDEIFNFVLRNPSGGVLLGDSTFNLTILMSDSVIPTPVLPFYQIATIHGENQTTFAADSNNVRCRIGGVVYGINYRRNGLGFYIHDHSGGIYIYSPTKTFGYTVTEGDSINVQGRVSQFMGFTEFGFLDTVIKINSGNGLLNPMVLSAKPDEPEESYLVRVNGLTYSSGWTNSGSGFTVKATKGGTGSANTYYIRIDSLTSAYGTPAPTVFDVIGLVSQYDTGAPYDFGYDINVRSAADIIRYNGINDVQDRLDVAIYPNPNNGKVYINAMLEATGDLDVKLYDLAGTLVYAQKRNGNKGENRFALELEQASSGLYVLELESNGKISRNKISINK